MELLPLKLNESKDDKIGARQLDLARKLRSAGRLSAEGKQKIDTRRGWDIFISWLIIALHEPSGESRWAFLLPLCCLCVGLTLPCVFGTFARVASVTQW